MGSKERREREKESLRQEIRDAARDLFAEQGYESVSMRKIAERIEYSPTTIYLYFNDKDELLFSLCEETFSKLVSYFDVIADAQSDPLEKLKMGLRGYVDFGLKYPNHYKVTFMQSLRPNPALQAQMERSMGHRAFEGLCDLVQTCVQRGLFVEHDARLISHALWACAHGVTSLLISKPGHLWPDKDRLIDATIEAAVNGFRSSFVAASTPDFVA
ncbi:MAG TPA: TetR/AcrR family transcriptional regulator [Blastocatellia bacterium]|nr:TetR/AcrR family transcriptional regulator [Blastocatellia bacterium]